MHVIRIGCEKRQHGGRVSSIIPFRSCVPSIFQAGGRKRPLPLPSLMLPSICPIIQRLTVGRGRREGNAILGQYFPLPPVFLLSLCLSRYGPRSPAELSMAKMAIGKKRNCADKGCMIVYSLNCMQYPLPFMSMNRDCDSRNLSE